MCFKCCLTLSLHALWMLHDWWNKASVLCSRCCIKSTASLSSSLSVCLSASLILSLWTVLVVRSSHASNPSSQYTGRRATAETLTNRDRDGRSHDSASPHPVCAPRRRTLTSWAGPELVQWLCQCHLMFCLAVSIVCWAPLLLSLLAWQPWV